MTNIVVKSTLYHIYVNVESRIAYVFEKGIQGLVGDPGIRGFPNTDASGYVSTAELVEAYDHFDAHIVPLEEAIADTWHNVTYLNSWATFPGFPSGRYIRYKDQVFLEGLVGRTGAASGETIFQLPSGYRPHMNLLVAVLTENGVGQLYILTTGEVKFMTGSPIWVGLFGICFGTE